MNLMNLDPSVAVRRRHLPSNAGEEDEIAHMRMPCPVTGEGFEGSGRLSTLSALAGETRVRVGE